MPYGGNDWLALTEEPTLEPEIAICDPHHHFWDFRTARIPYQPEIESREKEGVLASAGYRAGARVLARMGLSLDVGVAFPQLPELADFARALPDLTIVLNHLGGLNRSGPYANKDDEVLPAWRQGVAAVAQCPNVN